MAKYKSQTIISQGLRIDFKPNAEGGLRNAYLRFEHEGQFIPFSEDIRTLKKLRKMVDLAIKAKTT